MLPRGVTSRIVARSGMSPTTSSPYIWHAAPDGGATFAVDGGGWVYVSNSEIPAGGGGAGALLFDAAGNLINAYSILLGTTRNCAGGATPWNTWLSCEEHATGLVYECDPLGIQPAEARPPLGIFAHEAVAVDPTTNQLYLTEDVVDGRFYRFTPTSFRTGGIPDLMEGRLEVARVLNGITGPLVWETVPDPSAPVTPTRDQVPASTPFAGGEGIWYQQGTVFFSTKFDNRVWALNVAENLLSIIYDDDLAENPVLSGVDNVTGAPGGEILVAEDGGNMEIVAIRPNGSLRVIVRIIGHSASEITGPAFDPSGKRLYFSSQRGNSGNSADGVTYEIAGPILA